MYSSFFRFKYNMTPDAASNNAPRIALELAPVLGISGFLEFVMV